MLNAQIIGNLGKDAEMKEINGNKFAVMKVAVSEYVKKEKTITWISVLWSSPIAEKLLSILKKGSKVYVDGKQKVAISEDGQYINISIMANNVQVISYPSDEKKEE